MRIYSIYDNKAAAYMRPFFHRNNATAVRDVEQGVNDPQSDLSRAPGDFDLFCLAEWDEVSGKIEVLEKVENLGNLVHFVRGKE